MRANKIRWKLKLSNQLFNKKIWDRHILSHLYHAISPICHVALLSKEEGDQMVNHEKTVLVVISICAAITYCTLVFIAFVAPLRTWCMICTYFLTLLQMVNCHSWICNWSTLQYYLCHTYANSNICVSSSLIFKINYTQPQCSPEIGKIEKAPITALPKDEAEPLGCMLYQC